MDTRRLFITLVSAGLWEKDVELRKYGATDFKEIMRLAEEQSLIGLITAGLEHVKDVKVPQEWLLQFIGSTLQIEQQSQSMNEFLARLMERLRDAKIFGLLVKGQGVAQCYEKPLWRTSGDIDLLLDKKNYEAAKAFLIPLADEVATEDSITKHQALVMKGFDIELHGRMPFSLSKRVDMVIDEVIHSSLKDGQVRAWQNNGTDVFLPSVDNDVILVFTHFLHHFFIEGVGLRQMCDWCRLLYSYREKLDLRLLETRIRRMGLMSEWRVFYHLATKFLGLPDGVSCFKFQVSGASDKWLDKKAERVLKRILKSGNFGHNNDLSYRTKYKGMAYKVVATWRRFVDFASLVPVFPMDMPRFYVTYLANKMKGATE